MYLMEVYPSILVKVKAVAINEPPLFQRLCIDTQHPMLACCDHLTRHSNSIPEYSIILFQFLGTSARKQIPFIMLCNHF
jgi:hypothetical protein